MGLSGIWTVAFVAVQDAGWSRDPQHYDSGLALMFHVSVYSPIL